MEKKNLYYKFDSAWNMEKWLEIAPRFSYKVVPPAEFPPWLPSTWLSKCNSATIATSGNEEVDVAIFFGYRVDGLNLDEHPYICTYNKITDAYESGFIDHADYVGRTTPFPKDVLTAMSLSGIQADIKLHRHPDMPTGTLDDLSDKGILTGYEKAIEIQAKKAQTSL